MDATTMQAIRTRLEGELASVEHQLEENGVTPGTDEVHLPIEEGFADSAQATTERSAILSLIEQLQTTHREVAAALHRMEEGTYGKCEGCGQEIASERLEAVPTARQCVTCKQAAR